MSIYDWEERSSCFIQPQSSLTKNKMRPRERVLTWCTPFARQFSSFWIVIEYSGKQKCILSFWKFRNKIDMAASAQMSTNQLK